MYANRVFIYAYMYVRMRYISYVRDGVRKYQVKECETHHCMYVEICMYDVCTYAQVHVCVCVRDGVQK